MIPGNAHVRPKCLSALLVLLLLLGGCSSTEDELPGSAEAYLYNQAAQALEDFRWSEAITLFQQLESQFPFGEYAAQAQIELVYAYYRNGEPEAARAAADRFIRLYPDHQNIDYAYYMRGMAFYSADASLLTRFLPTDPSKRDPGRARESFSDFSQLLSRFPDSPYAADAQARMVYLRNLLAAYEVNVAEFYIRRQAYVASLNRARYVVENYQGAPAVPRAMEIMVEMYLRLGLDQNAERSLEVLKLNYPDSSKINENGEFILAAEVTDPSLLYYLTFGLLGSGGQPVSIDDAPPPPDDIADPNTAQPPPPAAPLPSQGGNTPASPLPGEQQGL